MDLHQACVNTIKGLAMDAVQQANSGHPGMPMGAADMATVLFKRFLRHDPADPSWPDRDRFVLSAGHGSMLLYSMLHLTGYPLTLDDLKNFRQLDSKTPGHPEYGHTAGVETTTGPLGQGFAMGVGLAMAERWLRERFGAELVDHWTWAICGDGDLMEGISSEAASLAGHLRLGRLVYLYDDNQISIDGGTDIAFTEDAVARLAAMGWHTQRVDGHDPVAIAAAIAAAREDERPSLIACRTVIGQDSAKQGTSATHGAPLGHDDIRATKERLGMDPDATFVVPEAVTTWLRDHDGAAEHAAWRERVAQHPRGAELMALLERDWSSLLDEVEWPAFEAGGKLATRKASASCLKALTKAAPELVGGSADLAGSNGTNLGHAAWTPESFAGQTIHFGVREHAMAAACNGMSLHGGVRPYCATFLVFHDYMRPAVRLSALMNQGVQYIYTHDSIFLGEDGPTHQPIETLLALRALPNTKVWRPADATETREAWKASLAHTTGPSCMILTRQGLPILDREALAPASGVHHGGYVLSDADDAAVVLVATGSEVALALSAQAALAAKGIAARVVSMPSVETFLEQDEAYRQSVLPAGIPRVSLEAGTTLGWRRIVGDTGASLGIDTFGASAPISDLAKKFGFTVERVLELVDSVL